MLTNWEKDRKMEDLGIRRATENDVADIRQLFVTSYGRHYRYREFYDDYWLKKAIFSDNYLVLVATRGEQILGSASITFLSCSSIVLLI